MSLKTTAAKESGPSWSCPSCRGIWALGVPEQGLSLSEQQIKAIRLQKRCSLCPTMEKTQQPVRPPELTGDAFLELLEKTFRKPRHFEDFLLQTDNARSKSEIALLDAGIRNDKELESHCQPNDPRKGRFRVQLEDQLRRLYNEAVATAVRFESDLVFFSGKGVPRFYSTFDLTPILQPILLHEALSSVQNHLPGHLVLIDRLTRIKALLDTGFYFSAHRKPTFPDFFDHYKSICSRFVAWAKRPSESCEDLRRDLDLFRRFSVCVDPLLPPMCLLLRLLSVHLQTSGTSSRFASEASRKNLVESCLNHLAPFPN